MHHMKRDYYVEVRQEPSTVDCRQMQDGCTTYLIVPAFAIAIAITVSIIFLIQLLEMPRNWFPNKEEREIEERIEHGAKRIQIERRWKMPRIFRWIAWAMVLMLLWKFVSNVENIVLFFVKGGV